MKKIALLCSALVISTPAWAAPFTYGPDNCEFEVTFPEKPFIEKKCGHNVNNCTEVVSYTKAIGADASTNFRITCNPISAEESVKYTPEIIAETLNQLVKSNNLEPYNTQSSAKENYKSASAISLSQKDGKPLIYNGQIWIGKTSMFTVEAEMLGPQNDDIQKTFASILRSTYPKDSKPVVSSEPAKAEPVVPSTKE